jgi:hypothetical protein
MKGRCQHPRGCARRLHTRPAAAGAGRCPHGRVAAPVSRAQALRPQASRLQASRLQALRPQASRLQASRPQPAPRRQGQWSSVLRCVSGLLCAVGALLGAAACADADGGPVTIIVDADRSRLLADQARLVDLRQGLDADRAQLLAARDELRAARVAAERAFEQATSESERGDARAALAGLRDREQALAVAVAAPGGAPVTRDEVQRLLLESEERLRTAWRAELVTLGTLGTLRPGGSAAVDSGASTRSQAAGTPRADPAALAAWDGLQQRLRERRLDGADLGTAGAADVDRARALLNKGDPAALPLLADLTARADAAVVTRNLVRAKYTRTNARLKANTAVLDVDKRRDLEARLAEAAAAIQRDDVGDANTILADIGARLP